MAVESPLRRRAEAWLFARRGALLAALLLALATARLISDRPVRPSALALLALAMGWRLWAGRNIGVHSNGARMEGDVLATRGPYAFGRHPLYLSNLAAVAGLLLFANCLPALGAALLFAIACLHHVLLARAEENRMDALHGEAWRSYRAVTPRWFGISLAARAGLRDDRGPEPAPLAEAWRRQGFNLAKPAAAALLLWALSLLSLAR